MTKILIPRSDSISAKIIEPSDFEKFYTDDIIPDYKKSGFTLTAGSGLAVNVSSGVVRLKGLYLESSASETVSSLTASDVNYIYVKLARDSASEAESWDFDKNLTGTTPTDAFFIGTATTNGSAVTAVDQSTVIDIAIPKFEHMYYGDGSDGDVTISSNTNLSEVKKYENLTINAGQTLSTSASSHASLIIQVRDTLTINGTISMDGKGAAGGAGGFGGAGGGGGTPSNNHTGQPGSPGAVPVLPGGWGHKDTTDQGTGNSSGSGQGGTSGGSTTVDPVTNLYYKEGVKTAAPNTRTGIPFYIATTMPQMYGSGGSGGSGGGGGAGADVPGGSGSSGSGGTGGAGGIGGNGGGGIILMAKTIVFNSGAVITADGATGGTGVVSATPGTGVTDGFHGNSGGGGGGGEGGQIILLYNYLTNSGTFTVTGGSAGAGGAANTGSGQGSGSAGNAGGAGQAGATKLVALG